MPFNLSKHQLQCCNNTYNFVLTKISGVAPRGCQHTILPKSHPPNNCMKLKFFSPRGVHVSLAPLLLDLLTHLWLISIAGFGFRLRLRHRFPYYANTREKGFESESESVETCSALYYIYVAIGFGIQIWVWIWIWLKWAIK